MRRGAEYGRALGMAAGDMAIGLSDAEEEMRALVVGDIAAIHERVCLAEEEAPLRRKPTPSAKAREGPGPGTGGLGRIAEEPVAPYYPFVT